MRHDLDAQIEVAGHAPHDGQLLEVLLTEHGDVRTGRGQELGDHRGDTVEMAGP
jgi:hypothetical protein